MLSIARSDDTGPAYRTVAVADEWYGMDVSATVERSATTLHDMIAIPGGTFRMGSDKHYPQEAPVIA